MALLQESLSNAVKTGAMKPQDTRRLDYATVHRRTTRSQPTPSSSIEPAIGSSGWPGRPGSTCVSPT